MTARASGTVSGSRATQAGATELDAAEAALAGFPWRKALLIVAGLGLALLIGLLLREQLRDVRYAAVLGAIEQTPDSRIAWALLFTALSFLVLSGYDASGLRYVGAAVPRRTVLLTSFTAYALGNTVGFGVLTGGAVRMRMYTAAGVEPADVARAIAFNAGAFGLGVTAFGALGLLWGAPDAAAIAGVPAWLLRLGAAFILLNIGAALWLCRRQREITIAGRWKVPLPPAKLAWQQLAISAGDLFFAGAALWVLLPEGAVALPAFVAFYAIALALSVISHVPGGLGVFEAVILLACGDRVPADAVLGALLVYRGVYYLMPLLLAALLLGVYELRSGVAAPVGRAATHLSPILMAALTLIGGVWLLFSGVTPMSEEAEQLLAMHVPLPVVEASHFLGSITGLGLLFVARGLLHRLRVAWWLALGLSISAGVLALPNGIALSEGSLLITLAVLLLISRRQFDRHSSLIAQRLEPEWLLAMGGIVAATVWVLFFAYQDVPYARQLWWQFEFDAQAPRSLRAITGIALVAWAIAMWQLLRPTAGDVAPPTPEELDRAARIIESNPRAGANLALMGDKHLLFSPSCKSFIMFGKHRRSWIALFDPVGVEDEFEDLVWRFIEEAAEHGGRAVFYQVRPQDLSLYLDAGLKVFKLGEHANVPLAGFDLKGARRANLRSGVNRAEREGMTFEVLPPPQTASLLGELRAVSDAWLAAQDVREKGFSLGAFDDDYLSRVPLAVVRKEGRVLAFASILATREKEEASVDLMRYQPGAPNGTMDFLFSKLLMHFRDAGVAEFGLGMAPMSGMAQHRLASRWQRIGRLLYDHGERFYNFQGVRSFKEKFDPAWEARYMAAPGGAASLLALSDAAALIGGGLKGVIAK